MAHESGEERITESGLPIEPVYGPDDPDGLGPGRRARRAGRRTRTPAASTRRCTPAGPGRCASTPASAPPWSPTQRYQQLIAARHRRASRVAFDLPTQMGHDSDAADRARRGRQGRRRHRLDRRHADAVRRHPARQGLHVDDDQRPGGAAAADVPARRARSRASRPTSSPARSRTTCSRSTSPAAPTSTRRKPSLRLITDIFAYCKREMPRWNTISISGYHMAEAGATPAQEIAFTLADGIEYVRAAIAAGHGRRRLRAPAVLLLRLAHDDPRGGREVPRGPPDLGAGDARRVRREEPEVA